ncbi:MAG: hypothetical protein GXO23_06285 [Crenarchaeota archaeon]|nr:hypothetical protein [Thermoproteota archaeon]
MSSIEVKIEEKKIEEKKPPEAIEVPKEYRVYARVIEIMTGIAVAIMVLSLILYGSHALPPYVTLAEIVKYWKLASTKFWMILKGIRIHGYDWIFAHLAHADMVGMISVLFLATACFVGNVGLAIYAAMRRDVPLLMFAVIECIILLIGYLKPYIIL